MARKVAFVTGAAFARRVMGGMRGMRRTSTRVAWALAVAWTLGSSPSRAQSEDLQNDGWSSGQSVAFQSGFASGEIGAVRLVPTIACPCEVENVTLLFGGAGSTQMVTVHFWNDSGTSNDPGAPIGLPFDVSLTGQDDQLHELTFGGSVIVNGPFRVGIEFSHNGLPSIARDTDGTIASDRNFICASFGEECLWFRSSDFGVSGDWIIRATILPEPGRAALVAGVGFLALLARARRRAVDAMLEHCFETWALPNAKVRREHHVFERDGWRCTVPGCSSYRNLHNHHIRFRSACGPDDPWNRTALCAAHHQRSVHEGIGRIRIRGRAPDGLRFELPLVTYGPGERILR